MAIGPNHNFAWLRVDPFADHSTIVTAGSLPFLGGATRTRPGTILATITISCDGWVLSVVDTPGPRIYTA